MAFADRARIIIKSGKGGDGHVSFRREKYVPDGGPDGGDGGRGGSIYFVADSGLNTLLDFKFIKKIEAKNGENGAKKNCAGKSAEDVYVDVPKGTVVRDLENGKIIADLNKDESKLIIFAEPALLPTCKLIPAP